MFLQPKKTKFEKMFKGKNKGVATKGTRVSFGIFGLCSLENSRISARQIEAARKSINNFLKRTGKLWIRIFPDRSVTKKPIEVRQGKGKGSVAYWAALVKKQTMLFELAGVSLDNAKRAFYLASSKLPVKTSFRYKDDNKYE